MVDKSLTLSIFNYLQALECLGDPNPQLACKLLKYVIYKNILDTSCWFKFDNAKLATVKKLLNNLIMTTPGIVKLQSTGAYGNVNIAQNIYTFKISSDAYIPDCDTLEKITLTF